MADLKINDILQHQINLARLETQGFRSFIAPSLAETLREIRAILAKTDDITSQRQLRKIETAIRQAIQQQTGWTALNSELLDVADYENQFYANLIASGVTVASADRVRRLADNTMMVLRSGERFNTGLWPDFVRNNVDSQARAVNNIVRAGYAQGMTIREMRSRIGSLYDGMLTRDAEALARTGYNHFSTVGRRALAEANRDIIAREIPVVTFDSRTSDICLSISARYADKGWPVGQSPIGYNPYHFNCRTTVIPLAKGQQIEGTRASKGDQPGQIPASTTIGQFVRDQSPEWQDDLLGPTRAQLFREGKLDLRNLTDASLRPLDLPEIRRREGITG